jgi:protein gp37
MANSSIEWTEATWNPTSGCTKISPGCKHCYAEKMAVRLKAMGMEKYKNGFELTVHASTLDIPLNWKKPRLIFVDSMSDLFHEKVSETFISRVFEVMRKAHWHQYQILTKRSERLSILNQKIDWPANVWMGVSIENQDYKYRIDHLRNTDAAVKFLSLEPLLGPIPELDLENIGWVIVGGESGPKARAIREEWVIEIRDQCLKADVPFFFKQWGGVHKKQNGRLLEGITWDQMPACANAA